MEKLSFKFDFAKALEALLYVASNAPIPDRFHLCKILYFADRFHLEKYLRFIYGETYVAMRHGPVPSKAFNIMRSTPDEEPRDIFADDFLVVGRRAPNMEVFSESDVEALDWAIRTYGKKTVSALRRISHNDTVWKSLTDDGDVFENILAPQSIPMPVIDIVKDVQDGELLLEYLYEYNC